MPPASCTHSSNPLSAPVLVCPPMAVDQVQLTPTHPPVFQTLQDEDHALQFCDYGLPYKELDNDLAMAIDIVQVELKMVSSN